MSVNALMVCWGSAVDRGDRKHITTTNKKWHPCMQTCVDTNTWPRHGQLLKTHISFLVPSHTDTHKHPAHYNSAGSVCQCGMTVDLVCSMVCDRGCLSHFTVCLKCLSESGGRSEGVTALICHADRLGKEKSFQHKSYLPLSVVCYNGFFSVTPSSFFVHSLQWAATMDLSRKMWNVNILTLWKEQSHFDSVHEIWG